MKYIKRKQSLIVTGNTADDFQTKLNEALEMVAEKGYKHDLQFNMAYGLCAYIVYEEAATVAETLADKYELKGDIYRCYECPMFRPSKDKRVKYTTCGRWERHISHCTPCCEWFYEALEGGEIELNEESGIEEENT